MSDFTDAGKTNPIQTQNKPNLQNAKIKLIPCSERTYINFRLFGLRQNKPKQSQFKPNFKGKKAHYAEVFELCEYGRQHSAEELQQVWDIKNE